MYSSPLIRVYVAGKLLFFYPPSLYCTQVVIRICAANSVHTPAALAFLIRPCTAAANSTNHVTSPNSPSSSRYLHTYNKPRSPSSHFPPPHYLTTPQLPLDIPKIKTNERSRHNRHNRGGVPRFPQLHHLLRRQVPPASRAGHEQRRRQRAAFEVVVREQRGLGWWYGN